MNSIFSFSIAGFTVVAIGIGYAGDTLNNLNQSISRIEANTQSASARLDGLAVRFDGIEARVMELENQ